MCIILDTLLLSQTKLFNLANLSTTSHLNLTIVTPMYKTEIKISRDDCFQVTKLAIQFNIQTKFNQQSSILNKIKKY